jgi:anti-sigma regulatory factor (Ser/Thr protein kinase)
MSGEIDAPRIRLELTSRPEAARLVRSMASAAGEALGFDPELLSDVNTAVAEACNNVILHAYDHEPGPMSVELRVSGDNVEVNVRDRGCGIRQAAPEHDRLKVGFALMSALADRAEFVNLPDGGTEVRLSFIGRGTLGALEPVERHASSNGHGGLPAAPLVELPGDLVLTVSPVALLGPILGRLGRTLAPTAGFSLERCYDVYLLADALAAHAEGAAQTGSISVALTARESTLEFALSPLRRGASERFERVRPPQSGGTVTSLGERVAISALEGYETLCVSMRDHLRR